MYNQMTEAFIRVVGPIAGQRGSKFKEGWSTKLSYRTFKKLESEGYTKFNG